MPTTHERVGGAKAWVLAWWRALLAELVATALLVLLGVWAAVPALSPLPGGPLVHPPLAHVALAFGFVVVANVQTFGSASGGHMNPAVSLCAALLGRLPWGAAALYALAQCAGAALGFALLQGLSPAGAVAAPGGCTLPARGVAPPAAAAVELLLTAPLALLCCSLWAGEDAARPDPAAPVKVGLLIAGLIYAGGPLTGASMNPARSFGPALLQGHWDHHWVYWVGPLLGAAAAALLHRCVLAPRAHRTPPTTPAAAHEVLPLHEKPDC